MNGYLISDEFLRRGDPSGLVPLEGEPALAWPPDVVEIAREARLRVTPEAASVAFVAQRAMGRQPGEGRTLQANPLATDAAAEQLARNFASSRPAQFTAVRYPGIDAVGHYYLRYATPRAFGDVSDAERLQYGRVLERITHTWMASWAAR